MLGLKSTPTPVDLILGNIQNASFSRLNHRPMELSENNLTEFLNQPRRTRLTDAHDFAFLAPFEIVARSKGQVFVSEWLDDISPFRAIHKLQSEAPSVDLLQLSLVIGRIPLKRDRWRESLGARQNGRNGLEAMLHGVKHRVSPLETIASNKSLGRWFAGLLEGKHLTADDFFAAGGQLYLLECKQFLLQCGKSTRAIETYRGNRLIPTDQSSKILSDRIISGISRWFMSNQDSEGALPYKYWPSSDTYSTTDNPIRRFMASVAFNRMATALGRQDMKVAARKNLGYNLRRFYSFENGKGIIAWDGSVKLGSLALAGLAIIESPFAEAWKDELSHLRRTINELWQPSGAFRTFLYPADRNDNQNFYPGEALLFWATSLQQKPDADLLARALKSIFYYRRHFQRNPNPAFVPWHSQAAMLLYRFTGDPALRDFIFEITDWLLPHQQWGGSLESDYWGRFYTPSTPNYGPPHASATGVYLEGLVDALALAHEIGDTVRAASYRQAVGRGIRSIAQLQYRDDLDAYYISRKERVIGAIRTESDNNEIRIDNLQHGLMALLKYQDFDRRHDFDTAPRLATQSAMRDIAS